MARKGIASSNKPAIWEARGVAKGYSSSAGYVLIFALWGVVIFELLCLTLSKGARFAVMYQDAVTKHAETLYAARGACLYALSKAPKVSIEEESSEEESAGEEGLGEEGLGEEGLGLEKMMTLADTGQGNKNLAAWKPRRVEVGGIGYEVTFEDEGGKINLNAISEENRDLLRNFLLQNGVQVSEADTIVDSVLDWLDGDDFTHANGAESDYYQNLPDPYLAKNGPFDSLEEFVLIKGVTSALYEKVRKDITVHGDNPEINVNSASKEVLSSMPGISPKMAETIVSLREKKGGFRSMEELRDLFVRLGIMGNKFEIIRTHITVDYSPIMTLRAACLDKKGDRCEYRVVINNEIEEKEVIAAYID